MLTIRGWGVLAAAAGLLVAARLLGSSELAGLAAAAGAAAGGAAVLVGRSPLTYRADRRLSPGRVGVGETATAQLRFTNTGPRPTAGGAIAGDPVRSDAAGVGPAEGRRARHPFRPWAAGGGPQGGDEGRCLVPALGPGGVAEAAYPLPTGRRGLISVGPLSVRAGDLFGLVERRVEVAGAGRLVVHPRIRPVLALPGSTTRDARLGRTHAVRAPRGDDFFALREYEVGDDLRRVHWRSTARTGDLMLRQDERRFGEIATVLVDTRAGSHHGDSFERALEAAASVAAALVDDGRRLRFVTTGGFDAEIDARAAGGTGGRAEARWNALLEHLAVVAPDAGRPESFAKAVRSIGRQPGGPLAAVVAGVSAAELAALGALSGRLGLVLVAHCDLDPGGPPVSPAPGARVVPAGAGADFPTSWNQTVLSCGRRDVVRR